MPDNKFVLDLIKNLDNPFAGTSANKSGMGSSINAYQVKELFEGKVAAIFDGGESKYGKESTLVSLVGVKPKILRKGVIDMDKIEETFGYKVESL